MQDKCTERACPFPPSDGSTLCLHHLRYFSWDISLTDNAVEHGWDAEGRKILVGLSVKPKRVSKHATVDGVRIAINRAVSGRMIAEMLKGLREMSDKEREEYLTKDWVTWNLLEKSRWPRERICPVCGSADLRNISYKHRGAIDFWKCRFCSKEFSATTFSLFSGTILGSAKWVHGLWHFANDTKNGTISRFVKEGSISLPSAYYMMRRLQLAACCSGITIGYKGHHDRTNAGLGNHGYAPMHVLSMLDSLKVSLDKETE